MTLVDDEREVDPQEPVDRLLRDLGSGPDGLGPREAARRLVVHGPNALERRQARRWPRELLAQLTHPLALLLVAAGGLALAIGMGVLAAAIAGVVLLNAVLAFAQERQAEAAVAALEEYLPPQALVLRDGREQSIPAREIVPGDVLLIAEGDRVSADARLVAGTVELDLSSLTGESVPVVRSADEPPSGGPLLEERDLVFSGASVTTGQARGIVFATGMQTQLGRVAALSQRVEEEDSPLQQQVRRVAWLIAVIAVAVGAAFVPIGTVLAGLPLNDAVVFAIGLLVANVPEGLLPTITLALAVGVRTLARRRALVKRLSAVETLGSTTVICTDKTGTLTENRMRVVQAWTPQGDAALADVLARCSTASLESGDPTEVALLVEAARLGAETDPAWRERHQLARFAFDPRRKLMTTVDRVGGDRVIAVKGAPDVVLPRCTDVPVGDVLARADGYAADGLRVLAVARRVLAEHEDVPAERGEAERDLSFVGLVALMDPPRAEVADAVARCHAAGIRVIVVTGDHGLTAAAIARQIGIVGAHPRVVTGAELEAMDEGSLDAVLAAEPELVFARTSPEAKLRIADALRAQGEVVAMTGDGVNDAPALRAADIGVAMGRGGTDVAREAATMVLTDDDFATIVGAVEEGRRVFSNIRKFVLYIFAHAPAEVLPFLVFALSGGDVPLPLTAVLILAIDLGTETLPALALGRDPAEPGTMARPPRRRTEGVVTKEMLLRAWLVLGTTSAVLVLGGFLWMLLRAGWSPGDDVGAGTALHHAYLQATTMCFLGIVACQVGTAFAARTERAALRDVGLRSNPLLLWGIAFELVFAVALVYLPPLQAVFGTAGLPWEAWLVVLPFPFVVWGVDELRRARLRGRQPALSRSRA